MGGVGALQMHGTRSRRLVCKEVVAASSNYRNLTSGDLGIPLAVSRLGVTRLKKTRVVCLSDLFEGRGEKGQCDLVCVERPSMIGLMVYYLFISPLFEFVHDYSTTITKAQLKKLAYKTE